MRYSFIKTFTLSFFRGAALFLAATLIFFTVLFFERERLIAPFLKEYLADLIVSRGGPNLVIGELGGNYYSEVNFQNVRLVSPDTFFNTLSLPSVRLRYSLPELFSGVESFLSTLGVIVSGGELEISVPLKKRRGISQPSREGKKSLPWLPAIKGEGFTLKVNREGESVLLKRASFETVDSLKQERRFTLSVPEAEVTSSLLKKNTFSIQTELAFTPGRLLIDNTKLNNSIVTKSTRVDFGKKGFFHIAADLQVWGGEGTLDLLAEGGVIRILVEFDYVDLGEINRVLNLPQLPAKGFGSINVDMEFPGGRPLDSRGRLEAHVWDMSIKGSAIDEAKLTLSAVDGFFLFEDAFFQAGGNRVNVESLSLSRKSLATGKFFQDPEALSGSFTAMLSDVPAFLSLLGAKPGDFNMPEHELSASIVIRDGALICESGYLKSSDSTVEIDSAEVPLVLDGADKMLLPISGEGRVRVKNLKHITDIFSLPTMTGSLTGEISIGGTVGSPDGTFSFKGENVGREGLIFDRVSVQGKAEKERVVFSEIGLTSGEDTLEGSGIYDVGKKRMKETKFTVNVKDVSHYLALLNPELKKVSGRLAGSVQASGSFKDPRIVASVHLNNWVHPKVSILSGRAGVLLESRSLEVTHLSLSTSEGTLSGALSLSLPDENRTVGITIPSLALLRDGVKLTLLKTARIELTKKGEWFFKNISFSGSPGRVDLSGMLNSDYEADIKFDLTGAGSDGMPDLWNPKRIFFEDLSLRGHLTGSFASPKLSVSGEVKRVAPRGGEFFFRGLFGFDASSKGVQINQFNFSDNNGHRINLAGSLPFQFNSEEKGNLLIDADVNIDQISSVAGMFFSPPLPSGALNAKISVRGTPAEPLGALSLHAKDLTVPGLTYFPFLNGVTGDIDIQVDKKRVLLDKVSLSSEEILFSANGSWEFGKTFEHILNGEKLTLSDSMDISASLKIADISLLSGKTRALRRVEGGIAAQGRLSGPLIKPLYSISVSFDQGVLQTNSALPSLSDFSGEIIFENEKVSFSELVSTLGGSPFTADGTIFWGKSPYSFNIHFGGENLLYYRKNGIKIRGNTSLHFSGDSGQSVLRGEVGLTDSKFVRDVDFLKFLKFGKRPSGKKGISLFSFKNPPMKNTKLNVVVTSSDPFLVKNNFVRGTLRPELILKGTGEVPVLVGNVYIDPMAVSLPYGRMTITRGVLRFLETSPDIPTLDVNAEGKLLGYEIFLHAEGPYNEPVVTLTSIPPLPEDELLLLVLAGELPKDVLGDKKRGVGLNVAVYLSRSLLMKWFKSESLESDESILDRFNLEIGNSVTKTGSETVEAQFLVDRNIIGQKEAWFLTSERDRFDDFNTGIRVVFKFE